MKNPEDSQQDSKQSLGGKARAEKLSAEERSIIASDAAKSRWANRPKEGMPHVLEDYKNVLDIGGMKLPCAVIQTGKGVVRVLTENGITNAILGTRSGASKRLKKKAASEDGALLPLFLAPSQIKPFITSELMDGPLSPIDYVDGERVVRAYDAAILPAVCNIWLKAREAGALQKQQLAKAQKAEILIRALAETAIVALIDEVTGYETARPQNALQAYLDMVLRKELAAWVKRFPDEFYENIYRLKNWVWPGMRKNRISVVGHYTKDLVYRRIGPEVLSELEKKNPKNEKGNRKNKHHQWLTDEVGHPLLAQHMHTLIMFQRLALTRGYGWNRFVKMVDEVLPVRDKTPLIPGLMPLDEEDEGQLA